MVSIFNQLQTLRTLMKNNLETKGITGLSGNEGLTTLANKILDISSGNSGGNNVGIGIFEIQYTGNDIIIGTQLDKWMESNGDVFVKWGDGEADIVNPRNQLPHTYVDGINNHTITFVGNVTGLEAECFFGNDNITSLIFPSTMISIGRGCFEECSNLTSVTLNEGLTTLNDCFYFCSISSLTIPSTVTNLGKGCFSDYENFEELILKWDTSNKIIPYDDSSDGWAYQFPDSTLIYIPNGTRSLYESKNYPSDKLVENE